MNVVRRRSWTGFRQFLEGYLAQDRMRCGQLLFRGQSDFQWPLDTTLDRVRRFASDAERQQYNDWLLLEFRREAMRLVAERDGLPEGVALELLARHHGLPSQLIDWTRSPYYAAYFAFAGGHPSRGRTAAIWMLDRAELTPDPGADLVDDPELLRFNRRALHQRGLFTRITTIRQPVEALLDRALTKILIPYSERRVALNDLDEMGINAAALFPDLGGAAVTARLRLAV